MSLSAPIPVTNCQYLSLSITVYHDLSLLYHLSLTIAIAIYHYLSLSITVCRYLSLLYRYLSRSITVYHCLSISALFANICHPSMSPFISHIYPTSNTTFYPSYYYKLLSVLSTTLMLLIRTYLPHLFGHADVLFDPVTRAPCAEQTSFRYLHGARG